MKCTDIPLIMTTFYCSTVVAGNVEHGANAIKENAAPMVADFACTYNKSTRTFEEPNAWVCFALCLPAEPKVEGESTIHYKTVLRPEHSVFEFLLLPFEEVAKGATDPVTVAERMETKLRKQIEKTTQKVGRIKDEIVDLRNQAHAKHEKVKALDAKAKNPPDPLATRPGTLSDEDHAERSKALSGTGIAGKLNELLRSLTPLEKELKDFHELFKRLDPNLRNTATALDAAMALNIESASFDPDAANTNGKYNFRVAGISFSATATADRKSVDTIKIMMDGKIPVLACDVAGTHIISSRETKKSPPCDVSQILASITNPNLKVLPGEYDWLNIKDTLKDMRQFQDEGETYRKDLENEITPQFTVQLLTGERIELKEQQYIKRALDAVRRKPWAEVKKQYNLAPAAGMEDLDDAIESKARSIAYAAKSEIEATVKEQLAKGTLDTEVAAAKQKWIDAKTRWFLELKSKYAPVMAEYTQTLERLQKDYDKLGETMTVTAGDLQALAAIYSKVEGIVPPRIQVNVKTNYDKENKTYRLDLRSALLKGQHFENPKSVVLENDTVYSFEVTQEEASVLAEWFRKRNNPDPTKTADDDDSFPLRGKRFEEFCRAMKEPVKPS